MKGKQRKSFTVYIGSMPTPHSQRFFVSRGGIDRGEIFKTKKDAEAVYGKGGAQKAKVILDGQVK